MSKTFVIYAWAALLAATSLAFGYFSYPPAGYNDGSWFIAPAINYTLTGKFVNPIALVSSNIADPTGAHRVLYYPPLFPIFLRFFLFPNLGISLPNQAFFVIAAVNAIVIILSAFVLRRTAVWRERNLNWTDVFLISAALFIILRASWSFAGRPEVLVRLFFTVGAASLLLLWQRPNVLAIILGGLLGLIAADHVTATILFFSLIILVFAWQHEFLASFKYLLLAAFAAISSFVAVMQLSPFGIKETIVGTYSHGKVMLSLVRPWEAVRAQFTNPSVVLLVIAAAAVSFFTARIVLRRFREQKNNSPFLALFAAGIVVVYAFFAFINTRNYYITPFLLGIFAVLLYWLDHLSTEKFPRFIILIFFAAMAAASLKHFLLFPYFLKDGMSLSAAREKFASVDGESRLPAVLYGTHVWALSENYAKMFTGSEEEEKLSRYVLLREEWEHPNLPDIESCRLAKNFYSGRVPKLFGFRLAPAVPGYNFAIYECAGLPAGKTNFF